MPSKYNRGSTKFENAVLEFLIERPDFFLTHLCEFYSLSINLIERFKDLWDWSLLTINEHLPWDEEFIEKYESKWNWDTEGGMYQFSLFGNDAIEWTDELKYKYIDRMDLDSISQSTSLLRKYPNILDKYKEKLHWDYISGNEHLDWTAEMLKKYESFLDWKIISGNKSVPWTDELIERYIDKFNRERYESGNIEPFLHIKNNSKRERTESSQISVDISQSNNELIKYSESELAKLLLIPDWEKLSRDPKVPWDEVLIDWYIENWEWGHTEEIEYSEQFWDIKNECYGSNKKIGKTYISGLSNNPSIPWSIELIEKYEDKIFWHDLSYNEGVPWSLRLLERFNDKWDWDALRYNEYLWNNLFYPSLNEKSISRIIMQIQS